MNPVFSLIPVFILNTVFSLIPVLAGIRSEKGKTADTRGEVFGASESAVHKIRIIEKERKRLSQLVGGRTSHLL